MADYQIAATRLREISDRAEGFLSSTITREPAERLTKPPVVGQTLLWANEWQEGQTLYRIAIEGHGNGAGDLYRRFCAIVNETGVLFNSLVLMAHEATGCRWRSIPSMNISEALDLSPQELVQRSDDEGGGSFVSRCADLVSAVIRLLEIELQTAGGTVKFTEDQEPGERDTVDARPTCVHGEDGTLVVDGLRRKFDGGTIVFHPDRVELCGATICGGARAGRQRKVLDLLRLKNADGQFKAYSSKSLAQNVGVKDGNSAAGLIRDLRARISKSLLEQVGIDCGLDEVILSGNQGYRFPEKLSVQENDGSEGTCLHSHDAASALDRDPDDSDRDKGHDSDGDPNRDCDDSDYDSDRELVPDSGSSSPEARQEWIVGELREGTKLKAPMIADELKCSIETVRRDLDVLKAAGKIEYVGSARSGHYRLTDGG